MDRNAESKRELCLSAIWEIDINKVPFCLNGRRFVLIYTVSVKYGS